MQCGTSRAGWVSAIGSVAITARARLEPWFRARCPAEGMGKIKNVPRATRAVTRTTCSAEPYRSFWRRNALSRSLRLAQRHARANTGRAFGNAELADPRFSGNPGGATSSLLGSGQAPGSRRRLDSQPNTGNFAAFPGSAFASLGASLNSSSLHLRSRLHPHRDLRAFPWRFLRTERRALVSLRAGVPRRSASGCRRRQVLLREPLALLSRR